MNRNSWHFGGQVKVKWDIVCQVLRIVSSILQIQPLLLSMALRIESGKEPLTDMQDSR